MFFLSINFLVWKLISIHLFASHFQKSKVNIRNFSLPIVAVVFFCLHSFFFFSKNLINFPPLVKVSNFSRGKCFLFFVLIMRWENKLEWEMSVVKGEKRSCKSLERKSMNFITPFARNCSYIYEAVKRKTIR